MVTELISEVERINKIVQGLLSFARPSDLNTSDINIEQLINQTLLLVTNTLRKQNVEVEFEYFTDNTISSRGCGTAETGFPEYHPECRRSDGEESAGTLAYINNKYRKGTPINTHSVT